MNDKLKKLASKNPQDFEPVAFSLVNEPDVELFKELVANDNFLFDFVKDNISKRLLHACNSSNYLNLIEFLKYYSPSYEEFIISTLSRYADEDLTDKMLEIFESGSLDEKTYCAKFFAHIQDPLALDLLKKYAYDENSSLSSNCASTLSAMGDTQSFDEALSKLNSNDEFEKLDAVRFLVSYGNKSAVNKILSAIKTSSMAENMAGEILYLENLPELIKNNKTDGIFILNLIINGLGEILGLSQIFDFQLYDTLENLINSPKTSEIAVVLLNAKEKFNTLTENDEYLFDETKDVKQEVNEIKFLLQKINTKELKSLIENELNENSLFVYQALDITDNPQKIRQLLNSKNQTVILKATEILKKLNFLTEEDKMTALKSISNESIKNVIMAI